MTTRRAVPGAMGSVVEASRGWSSRLRVAMKLTVLGLVAVGCRREPPTPVPVEPVAAPSTAPPPTTPGFAITHRVTFALATVKLTIADAKMTSSFEPLLQATSADAVVNGEFFDLSQRPLGLTVSGGKTISPIAPRLSGGVLWVKDHVGHLTASEAYRETSVDFAIQCRPRLIVDGKNNIRTDDGKRAARTALCLRDGGRSLEIVLAGANDGDVPPTLFELGAKLASDGCEQALNLDGGPSTGGAFRNDGGVVGFPARGPVRHAIVVRPESGASEARPEAFDAKGHGP